MLGRLVESISRYSMFERGQRIGVAVSGGADSVALLYLLSELASSWELELAVVHLNHCLRGLESDEDEQFVAGLAAKMALPYVHRRVDVAAEARRVRANLEQMARQSRIRFFAELISGSRLHRIALGHTKDDQAETVLFRILRGAGPEGIRGILPVTKEGLVRPLLDVRREQLRQYLTGKGVQWREDSTNHDLRRTRNRIRHVLLPELARNWNPRVVDALARLAQSAAEDNQYLESAVLGLMDTLWQVDGPGLVVRCKSFQQLPAALHRRVLRAAIRRVKGTLLQFDRGHLEVLENIILGKAGHGRAILPGIEALRSLDLLRLQPYPRPAAENGARYRISLHPPCRVQLPMLYREISFEVIQLKERDLQRSQEPAMQTACSPAREPASYNSVELDIDWDRLANSLVLRNARPGDRYRPIGSSAPVKLKKLFQRGRVPIWRRGGWPVLCSGERIVWCSKFGPDGDFQQGPDSRNILRIRERSVNLANLESPDRLLASQLIEGVISSEARELS